MSESETKKKVRQLVKKIERAEDRLSELTSSLWTLVCPSSDEIEGAQDCLRAHEDNYDPTDLQVLITVLKGRCYID